MVLPTFLLEDKKNLSKIWLAAHWEKKLKRYHVYQIDIERSVQDILCNEIIMDLRLSGHLLVGIVKIFSRKAKYLLHECSDIFNKVRIFRSNIIDLPPSKTQASVASITLPEIFESVPFFENFRIDDLLTLNQSRSEDITLKECTENVLRHDGDFDEENFDDENRMINFDEDIELLLEAITRNQEINKPLTDRNLIENMDDNSNDGQENTSPMEEDINNGLNIGPENIERHLSSHVSNNIELISIDRQTEIHNVEYVRASISIENIPISHGKTRGGGPDLFLQPLAGTKRKVGQCAKRKKPLILDTEKVLKRDVIVAQFQRTSDITVPLDLAPPSKRSMILKATGNCQQLLQLPGCKINNGKILSLFKRHLRIDKTSTHFESSSDEDQSYPHEAEILRRDISDESNGIPDIVVPLFEVNAGDEEMIDNNELNTNLENMSDYPPFEIEVPSAVNGNNEDLQNDSSLSQSIFISQQSSLQEKMVKMMEFLKISFQGSTIVKFSEVVAKDKKTKVAQKFLSILMLKKYNVIKLRQKQAYDEIFIYPGDDFDSICCEFC